MAVESYIQLPTDGSGRRLRTFEHDETDDVTGDAYTVAHEGVALVDADAEPLLRGRTIPVTDQDLVQRLDTLIEGVAHLLVLLSETSRPKSSTRVMNAWVANILGGRRNAA